MADLMRLDLVVNVRFPGTRAHAIQVAAMAEALANTGLNVDVVVPRRFPHRHVDPWLHHGVRRNFVVNRIANLDLIDLLPTRAQRLPFLVQSVTFGLRALARAAVEREAGVLVRDHYTLEILANGLPARDLLRVAAEVHNLPAPGARRRRVAGALRRLPAVITISDGLADDLVSEGLDPATMLVARDGVHLARFADLPAAVEARRAIGIPADVPTVVYAGHLYPWKGVDTLVEAMGSLPEAQLLLVGGDKVQLPRLEHLAGMHAPGRVVFTGRVPHGDVPFYLSAGDVVVLPNSAREEISARYTSPLKLFEAMASRRAIVASDLPSLREVLVDDRNARLSPPDDPRALAEVLGEVLGNPALARRLADLALVDVQPYDWAERGRRVARFLRERLDVEGSRR